MSVPLPLLLATPLAQLGAFWAMAGEPVPPVTNSPFKARVIKSLMALVEKGKGKYCNFFLPEATATQ